MNPAGVAVGAEMSNSSPIGRLLEEISWEGNATPYRMGGRGREDVLTTEVFGIFDFLPRTRFLGEVLRVAHGADQRRSAVVDHIESLAVSVLPGDIRPALDAGGLAPWTVQPDVLLEDANVCCMVEAKRIRPSRFHRSQLPRTLLALHQQAAGRIPLLLLVLGKPPPIAVTGLGCVPIEQAISRGLLLLEDPQDRAAAAGLAAESLSWISWRDIANVVSRHRDSFGHLDPSTRGSIHRMADALTRAVAWHA